MTTKKVNQEQVAAAVYTVDELAEASNKLFDAHKIIVKAALRTSGKEKFTEEEALKIVNVFRKKEVK